MGGGAMFTPFLVTPSRNRGLADPHILSSSSMETTTDDLDSNQTFSTHFNAPFKPSSSVCTCCDPTCEKGPDSCVFGPVPTTLEVEKAISDLRLFMRGLSKSEPHLNLLQSSVMARYEPRMLQSSGYQRIRDAFSMLETEPSMQKLVVSISRDKAVWEAILRNEAVRNLRPSLLSAAKEEENESSREEESGVSNLLLKWIKGITKSRIVELIDKFGQIVSEIFQSTDEEEPTSELSDLLEEKVRSSVLLSMVILMIVVVTRNHEA